MAVKIPNARHTTQIPIRIFMLKNHNNILLFLIIIFATLLRLYGINYEIPHPDDYSTILGALHFGIPHVGLSGYGIYSLYCWPAFTMVIIEMILFTIYFLFGWIFGVFSSMSDFRNLYLTDPSSFYLIGRLMSVAFGVGTVWILYHLGKMLYNEKVGLLAALFLSVSFIHSFHSQYVRPDIPATFFIMMTIFFCLRIRFEGDLKYYVYAGISSGLSIATKFTSGVVISLIILAQLMVESNNLFQERKIAKLYKYLPLISIISGSILILAFLVPLLLNNYRTIISILFPTIDPNPDNIGLLKSIITMMGVLGVASIIFGLFLSKSIIFRTLCINLLNDRKLIIAFALVIVCFLIFDPLFLLNLKTQIRIFVTDSNFLGKREYAQFIGVDGLGFIGNLLWYIRGPINWGAGLHIGIMAICGVILALKRRRKEDILFLIIPILYLIAICGGKWKWERYAITLMPFIAIYASSFYFTFVNGLLSKRMSEKTVNYALLFFALIIIINPTYNIVRYDYLLTQKDTRTICKEWVNENIPHNCKIGQDAYTGELSNSEYTITKVFSLSNKPFDFYIRDNYQYLIVSDTQYERYFAESEKYPENVTFYRKLFSEGHLIKEITPRGDLWPKPSERFKKYHIHISPTIRIYKIDNVFNKKLTDEHISQTVRKKDT